MDLSSVFLILEFLGFLILDDGRSFFEIAVVPRIVFIDHILLGRLCSFVSIIKSHFFLLFLHGMIVKGSIIITSLVLLSLMTISRLVFASIIVLGLQ